MEQLELFTLGNNLVTAGHCLDALAKANDMMQALLNATLNIRGTQFSLTQTSNGKLLTKGS